MELFSTAIILLANLLCLNAILTHTRITDGPEDHEIAVGQPAIFRCRAQSDDGLSFEMIWLHDGKIIDFDNGSHFIKSSHYSLTISKTSELDAGNYTCLARSPVDEDQASATLFFIDVPNQPLIKSIECDANKKTAVLSWEPMGDNGAPILRNQIMYNTNFTPDMWETVNDNIPPLKRSYTFSTSDLADYSFRVIAWNKVGPSEPSYRSKICTLGNLGVPHKNPDNVKGRGDEPTNLVITWTPMPQIEHNGAGFRYRIFWKLDKRGKEYDSLEILDWKQSRLVIDNQPTFQRYRIKVVALNEFGEANVAPQEIYGYSGEAEPLQAPSNFTLLEIVSPTSALLSWSPVPYDSVRGLLPDYRIKIWTDIEEYHREIHVRCCDDTKALVTAFQPYKKNYAQVYVRNDYYKGPPSETISFYMPEGVPSLVASLKAYKMGPTAFYLKWRKPENSNGILRGYNIYYATVDGTYVGEHIERSPNITDPDQLQAKLAGLKPNSKYRISITAKTNAGQSQKYFIERKTGDTVPEAPSVPNFKYVVNYEQNAANVKIIWLPNLDNSGTHFYVEYKNKNTTNLVTVTDPEFELEYVVVRGLELQQVYEFAVVAVDGNFLTKSAVQEVHVGNKTEAGVSPVPNFNYEISCERLNASIKVTLLPNPYRKAGSAFYVQYKKKDETRFLNTETESGDHILIEHLEILQLYEFRVVAVDGDVETKSAVQEVYVGVKYDQIETTETDTSYPDSI